MLCLSALQIIVICSVGVNASLFGTLKHAVPLRTISRRGRAFVPETLYASRCLRCRGGSSASHQNDIESDEEQSIEDAEEEKRRIATQKWRMDQQLLMQLRSTVLSEALAKRGVPGITTLVDISTADGDKPPEKVDWDCAMSTEDDPKTCLYSFDAEPNTKVVAPIDTNQWITLSAINRLRRTDPTKVEPMWHSQYAILDSWFGDDSQFSLLQHVGVKGFLITLLLDTAKGAVLNGLLMVGILSTMLLLLPVLEFGINRSLVSGLLWSHWPTWGRIIHAALPLKLLLAQLSWKFLAKMFGKLQTRVREYIVDVECDLLESCIPLTVGPGSEVEEEDFGDELGMLDDEQDLEEEESDTDSEDEEEADDLAYFSADDSY